MGKVNINKANNNNTAPIVDSNPNGSLKYITPMIVAVKGSNNTKIPAIVAKTPCKPQK